MYTTDRIKFLSVLSGILTNRVNNYVLAGLDSHLLEDKKVRLFTCSRDNQDSITPHSHRFDFACFVIEGEVVNRVWTETESSEDGDPFMISTLTYQGSVGSHTVVQERLSCWTHEDTKYTAGDWYFMDSREVHSLTFKKSTSVLFFEGKDVRNTSIIIEPWVHSQVIRTYEKKDYMFLSEERIQND